MNREVSRGDKQPPPCRNLGFPDIIAFSISLLPPPTPLREQRESTASPLSSLSESSHLTHKDVDR